MHFLGLETQIWIAKFPTTTRWGRWDLHAEFCNVLQGDFFLFLIKSIADTVRDPLAGHFGTASLNVIKSWGLHNNVKLTIQPRVSQHQPQKVFTKIQIKQA